jgi:hypothetical protein
MSVIDRMSPRVFVPILLAVLAGCGGTSTDGGSTPSPSGAGPTPISLGSATDLGAAGAYAVLAKTGVTNVTGSTITGNVGVSPAAASYITGFALVADATNVFATSPSVVGHVYAASYAAPTPATLISAIGSMEIAYADAAGRTSPGFSELGSGAIGGLTLVPGLYKWTTSVTIPTNVTLSGGANDVWIFQISGDLTIAAARSVVMAGGAQARNVFWQVAGQSTLGSTSHFEGTILSKTAITLNTGASLNGRALAQSLVAMDNDAITIP